MWHAIVHPWVKYRVLLVVDTKRSLEHAFYSNYETNTFRAWKSTWCAAIKENPCKTKIMLVILTCLTISPSCSLHATFFCLFGTVRQLNISPDTGILTANSLKLRSCGVVWCGVVWCVCVCVCFGHNFYSNSVGFKFSIIFFTIPECVFKTRHR